jgi:hypothetical protein
MTIDWTFRMGEIAIVFATLMGPILAVQAQKWIERSREQTTANRDFQNPHGDAQCSSWVSTRPTLQGGA